MRSGVACVKVNSGVAKGGGGGGAGFFWVLSQQAGFLGLLKSREGNVTVLFAQWHFSFFGRLFSCLGKTLTLWEL